MEKKYLEFIEKFLSESSKMVPVPTSLEPRYKPNPSIRTVVFDVYGTILISASGDIEESVISTDNLKTSLNAAGIELSESLADPVQVLFDMLDSFKKQILRTHEEERRPDKPYPEVDILEIWNTILKRSHQEQLIHISDPLCIKCFTFVFELLCNNLYPMPEMKDVILKLASRDLPLGIISNAQFYTPVILNFFMHGKISESEVVAPFDPDITVFSYVQKRSKPDGLLFDIVKEQCRLKYQISPSEILFVGNDMFRDIYPAKRAGFKTALFAGDRKSLRLRKEKPETDGLEPDFIITELNQLLKIIA